MAGWLRANQKPDGRILDPVHREHGTYAAGFAGLAFGLMALRTGVTAWMDSCRLSVNTARQRPRDSEFDQLALLLAAALVRKAATQASDAPDLGVCLPAAETVALYKGRRLVSNNWIAMRALNYSLRDKLTGSRRDADEAARLWERVLGWQLPDGLFIDSPGGEATPVTYHAKFCAMLALALSETEFGSEAIQAALQRGLEAMAALVSPAGVLVPYGRSRNTLFGYAAAILAFRRGASLLDQPSYEVIASRLESRIAKFQETDGHVPCVLNEGETTKRDWDVYVNNSDYNAYAAALLLLADHAPSRCRGGSSSERFRGDSARPAAYSQSLVVCAVGPVLTVQYGDLFAALAVHGQAVPAGTPFFCDHRQYGLQPLWIERGDAVLLEPALYQWDGGEDRTALVEPGANPWIPYVAVNKDRYCVRRYEEVCVKQAGSVVEIEGEGRPDTYCPIPRWERGLRALLFRTTGHAPLMFRSAVLDGIRLRRRLVWDAGRITLRATTQVAGDLPAGASLHQEHCTWPAAPPAPCPEPSLVSRA